MAIVLAVILCWRKPDRPELFPFMKAKALSTTAASNLPARPKQPVHDATASQFAAAARIQEPVPVRELASRRTR